MTSSQCILVIRFRLSSIVGSGPGGYLQLRTVGLWNSLPRKSAGLKTGHYTSRRLFARLPEEFGSGEPDEFAAGGNETFQFDESNAGFFQG